MTRDPRVDPIPGDRFGIGGLYWQCTVLGIDKEVVHYEMEEGGRVVEGLTKMSREHFLGFIANAEIVKVAE